MRRKDFDAYLKSIGPEYEQFEKTMQLGQEGQAEIFASKLAQIDSGTLSNPPTPRAGQFGSLPPLEIIPPVFFEPTFDLSDKMTFADVTEQREGDSEVRDPASLSHSLPLLEKLSHYADTIELHLIREISLRSSSFFAALTNLNELQTESTQCLERIRNLRESLQEVDEQKAKKGLELVRLEKKVRNLSHVKEGVKTMQNVGELIGAAKSLANGSEWDAALNVIDGLGSLWLPEPNQSHQQTSQASETNAKNKALRRNSKLPSVPESITEEGAILDPSGKERLPDLPLSLLNAFTGLPEHLQILSREIAMSLTSELIIVLKTDLLTEIDTVSLIPDQPSNCTDGDVDNSRAERLLALRDRLRSLARGLKRTKRMKESVAKWTDVALVEIRASTKKVSPSLIVSDLSLK